MKTDRNAQPSKLTQADRLRRRVSIAHKASTPAYIIAVRFAVALVIVLALVECVK